MRYRGVALISDWLRKYIVWRRVLTNSEGVVMGDNPTHKLTIDYTPTGMGTFPAHCSCGWSGEWPQANLTKSQGRRAIGLVGDNFGNWALKDGVATPMHPS